MTYQLRNSLPGVVEAWRNTMPHYINISSVGGRKPLYEKFQDTYTIYPGDWIVWTETHWFFLPDEQFRSAYVVKA